MLLAICRGLGFRRFKLSLGLCGFIEFDGIYRLAAESLHAATWLYWTVRVSRTRGSLYAVYGLQLRVLWGARASWGL